MINNSHQSLARNSMKGFTLLELMIVIGLIVALAMMTLPYSMDFYRSRTLEEETRSLSSILDRARSNAISGRMDSNWGVYFESDNSYIIFKGERYEDRNLDFDQHFSVPSGMEVDTDIIEVVFERHTGNVKIFK